MRFVRKLCAWLLGSVFFIAGFLKLMDPVGAGLVVAEYFRFFGVGFLVPVSKAVGVALALFETLLGAAVITGVWRRTVAIVSGITMALFTLLTLVLLIFNPKMDCGCFGEVVHLTHLQSFLKNLILCLLWVGAYVPFRKMLPVPKLKYVSFAIVALSAVFFGLWSLLSIPMLDFTELKPGTELLQDEYVPDAKSLYFSDAEGCYANSLAVSGKVMVVSAYNPLRIPAGVRASVAEFMDNAEAAGFRVLLLAATTPEDIDGLASDPRLLTNLYFADRKLLLTLNRSNAGVTLIEDGQITRKWAARSLPDKQALVSLAAREQTEILVDSQSRSRLRVQSILLYTFAVMLLL